MTPFQPGSTQSWAIQTRELSKRFGSRWAVDGIELRVPCGSVYGFLGLNGAGKSTTIRMLMGLLQRSSGEVSVLGLDPEWENQDIEIKQRVGYVPDAPSFYEWMSVRQILAFVAHYRNANWDAAWAARLLELFDLPPDQRLQSLSKGQRAKVNLTLALAFHPEILILDEPTGGLDPVARRQFIEGVLAQFMEKEQKTVFISSHLVNEISGLVDYVGIMHQGKLVRQEPVESLLASVKRVRLVYEDTPPPRSAFNEAFRYRAQGREVLLTFDRFGPAVAAGLEATSGAKQVSVEDLNLEEVFVELESPAQEERS